MTNYFENWTADDVERHNKAIAENRSKRLPATQQESLPGLPLECAPKRQSKGSSCPPRRFEITFTVYAVRPQDWDNPDCKRLQDLVVRAGILPDDNWKVLQGRVISRKADSEADERIEIEIQEL